MVKLSCKHLVLALCLVAFGSPAAADPAAECNDGTLEVAVRGCTTLIEKGSLKGENLATAYLNRAIAFASMGKARQARADIDRAINVSPKDPLLYYNRGNLLFDARKFNEAVADYSAAIALDGTFAHAYLNRGLAHEILGNIEATIADLHRAIELDPSLTQAREELTKLQGSS